MRLNRKYCGIILSFILLFCSISCYDLFLSPDPGFDPETIFELIWDDFDRTYSLFIMKNIHWDSLYTVYRPMVSASTTNEDLFDLLSKMLYELRDAHVNLYTPFGSFNYDEYYTKYPVNIINWDTLRANYLTISSDESPIIYGAVRETPIGYIRINTFRGEENNFTLIDQIVNKYKNYIGLIIDVRQNTGGFWSNAEYVASRFSDDRYVFAYVRYRNGPRHSDFGDYIPREIKPEWDIQFTKPIIVLTNRRSFSATEGFVLAMKCFPNVIVIGDTTGGGSSIPIARGLPNGWTYRLSRLISYDRDKISYEGIGISPDIPVQITEADSIAGKDTILETAIELIQQQSVQ